MHRLVGLPGTIGFPTVSRRALDLESLLGADVIDAPLARVAMEKLRRAFTRDLADAPALSAPQRAPANGLKILIAEDHADQRRILGVSLATAGFLPMALRSGDGVVDKARVERGALILLDIGMPRLNGYDTARQIRQQSWGKHVALVALTGWGQDEDRRKSQEAGFDSHMVKPLQLQDLERLLASSGVATG